MREYGLVSKKNDEGGAIMLITVIMIVSLITLVTLAIDASINMTTQAQYERTATDAALAAAEAYMASTSTTPAGKIDAATARAQELVNLNVSGVSLAQRFIDDSQHVVATSATGTNHGLLEFGVWYFTDPGAGYTGCGNGPITGTSPTPFRACFRPITLSDTALLPQLNAFRLNLSLRDPNLVRTIFGGILAGNTGQRLNARSTAAIVPRYFIFMPDVTRSVTYSTYTKINPTSGIDAHMTYPATNNTCSAFPGIWDARWNALPSARGTETSPNMFYKSDYGCLNVECEIPETSVTEYYHFRIDTFSGRRPEPLDTILDSINQSLTQLRERGTAADRAGLLAFDSDIDTDCRLTLNANSELGMISSSNALYDRILQATDTNLSVATRSLGTSTGAKNFMLFPKGATVTGGPLFTDIFRTLGRAQTMLNNDVADLSAVRAEMILYSDGKSNCYEDFTSVGGTSLGRVCRQCSTDSGCGTFNPADQVQRDNFSSQRGINEVLSLFDEPTDDFIANRVAFSVFLFGNVGPHEVVYTHGGGTNCMSQNEIISARDENGGTFPLTIAGNGNATDPNSFADTDKNAATPPVYIYSNALAQAVANSGGFWIPIRPPCSTSGVDFGDDIQLECQAQAPTLDSSGNPVPTPVDLAARLGCVCGSGSCTRDGVSGSDAEICNHVDNAGRLFCDLQNRTPNQQIIEGMNAITSINPFVPVDVR